LEPQAILDFIAGNTRPKVAIQDCPYVLFTTTRTDDRSAPMVIHLLNYHQAPLANVHLRLPAGARPRLEALTPGGEQLLKGSAEGEWVIPKLGVYSLVIVDQ